MNTVLELTNDQCKELERRANSKLQDMFAEQSDSGISLELCKAVVPAIICTLREYVRMSEEK